MKKPHDIKVTTQNETYFGQRANFFDGFIILSDDDDEMKIDLVEVVRIESDTES